jgi:branched-chain amino acid transport system ATP-binding protein
MTSSVQQPASSNGSVNVAQSPALELREVTGGYGQTTVLRDVSIMVPASGVTALLGPNGAGKTTLLKTVSGFLRPSSGAIRLFGDDMTGVAPYRRFEAGLCHVPEGRGVFRSLTVRENLIMQSRKGEEAEAISQACEVFPALGRRIGNVAGTLSGGEQQMLAMATAYIRSPRLIMVDEASLGLAPLVVDQIFKFMEKVAHEGKALLIVDQFATRALALADTAYVLSRGSVTYSGSAKELGQAELLSQYMGT